MMQTLERPNLEFPRMSDYYPETKEEGDWKISTLELTPERVEKERLTSMYRSTWSYWANYDLKPGRYVKLEHKGEVIMSDTPMERRTNLEPLRDAEGDVLITGLGLGMLPIALLESSKVASLTILEHSPEVIAMVEPVVRLAQAEAGYPFLIDIIPGDAWRPEGLDQHGYLPSRYDYIWLDIWGTWSGDQWTEIVALRRLWRRRLAKGGVCRAWLEGIVKRMAREDGEMATPERVRDVLVEKRRQA